MSGIPGLLETVSRLSLAAPASQTASLLERGPLGYAGAVLCVLAAAGVYTAVMSEDARPGEDEVQHEEVPALPRHLSALIGSLRGPADLGRNHDKYLTYADREEAGGAASA
ncbi:MAG TPA: hypothetical protein VNF47_26415 [Streptosporangiaceae bacterium]|nr:hypothetical protein [Streptosporangiaceae bacterium]